MVLGHRAHLLLLSSFICPDTSLVEGYTPAGLASDSYLNSANKARLERSQVLREAEVRRIGGGGRLFFVFGVCVCGGVRGGGI